VSISLCVAKRFHNQLSARLAPCLYSGPRNFLTQRTRVSVPHAGGALILCVMNHALIYLSFCDTFVLYAGQLCISGVAILVEYLSRK
jgi:hypothetical protein